MARVADRGEHWAALTGGLPLPLGGNAIRRGLGADAIAKVSRLCRASIAWSLANRREAMKALIEDEARPDLALDPATLDPYPAMYANHDTLAGRPHVRRAPRT